jgi:hypothetical protein
MPLITQISSRGTISAGAVPTGRALKGKGLVQGEGVAEILVFTQGRYVFLKGMQRT